MTRSAEDVERVLRLAAEGHNISQIARDVGVSRYTVRMWRSGQVPKRTFQCEAGKCALVPPSCGRWGIYAYLLGQYLGDGYIATHGRGVHRLRIACTNAYPMIMDEVEQAMRCVLPHN